MVSSSPSFCPNCGAANTSQTTTCFACGQSLTNNNPQPTPSTPLLQQRYRILSQLGQGGMGAVYKAEDTHLGNRIVAIKEMRSRGLSQQEEQEAAQGFEHESLLLAQLMHAHLPRVYDHFTHNGHCYLIMDFIAGQTLEDYLANAPNGKLPLKEVLDMGIQLCTVLDYLHTRQPPIIFRDLKPSNIMRTPDGQLYLIDFGIARHFKPGQARDTIAFGSPGYAAPEQYGKTQTSPRSDIYSLGALLHHMLTGTDPSITPFFFAPLNTGPAALQTLLSQMLEMDTQKRPASAALVKNTLQQIATQTLISPNPSPLPSASPRVTPTYYTPPTRSLHYTFTDHTHWVTSVAISANGQIIASGSEDKTVKVWDLPTGRLLHTLRGHTGTVNTVAISTDGRIVVSGSTDQAIKVWDLSSGKVSTLGGHSAQITSIALSTDDQTLVSGSADHAIKIWNLSTGQAVRTITDHTGSVNSLAISADTRILVSGSADKTIRVWNLSKGKLLRTILVGRLGGVWSVAASSDGKTIASGSSNWTIKIWNLASGTILHTLEDHNGMVNSLAISADDHILVSGSADKTIKVWNLASGNIIQTLTGHTGYVTSVAISTDGQTIVSGCADKTVRVWRP